MAFRFFLLFLVTTVALIIYVDNELTASHAQDTQDELQLDLNETTALLRNNYDNFARSLDFLYHSPSLHGLMRSVNNEGTDPIDGSSTVVLQNRLSQTFEAFIENHAEYFQLRIIDSQGYEYLRVDRKNERIVRVDEAELQDKKSRYYFTETSQLGKDELFFSTIDLNRENGLISSPYIPTLRVAKPIYSNDNTFFGIIIANIDLSALLERIDTTVTERYDLILIDADGFFIAHPNDNYRFSKDLRPTHTFSSQYVTTDNNALLTHYIRTEDEHVSLGLKEKIKIADSPRGGIIDAHIMLSSDIYKHELSMQRITSFGILLIVMTFVTISFLFLQRNSKKLSQALNVATEARVAIENARKQLEKKVKERTLELEIARDEALGASAIKSRFISTVSHEIRTPLNGIVGAVKLLKKEPLSPHQLHLLTMAENSTDSLYRIMSDVLDLSKIEAGKLELCAEIFDPETLIETVTSTHSAAIKEKGIELFIDTCNLHFSTIQADPYRLTQVINNLLNNATKFTSEGFVSLRAWGETDGKHAVIHISISDSGVGMSEEEQSQLFVAFSQANEHISSHYGGTGLGLSICREMLKIMGGTITVASKKHKGTTFTITLPTPTWEVKPAVDVNRLNGLRFGVASENDKQRTHLCNLISSNGGVTEVVKAPFEWLDSACTKNLIIDGDSPVFSVFIDALRNKALEPKNTEGVIVFSKHPLPENQVVDAITYILTPIYRSLFLSLVFDERGACIINETDVAQAAQRRQSDLVGALTVSSSLF